MAKARPLTFCSHLRSLAVTVADQDCAPEVNFAGGV
jgi:hypothetical protein